MARERTSPRDTGTTTKTVHVPTPWGSIFDHSTTTNKAPTENRYERAQEVFEILEQSGFVGSLDATNEDLFFWAPDLPLTLAALPVMGLKKPVAWMYASYEDHAAGRTFISLCGSINNYIGFAAGDQEAIIGWYPSSSPGLHAIIESLSNERGGVGEWTRLMSEPGRHEFYNLLSALSELPRGHIVGQAFMEVLAKVFHLEHDVKITFNGPNGVRGHFDTVLVGAPLWVRSATAKPLGQDGTIPLGFERSIEGIRSLPPQSGVASRWKLRRHR
jgi:hypothetical protein